MEPEKKTDNQMSMNQGVPQDTSVQRTFMLGDKWLFYKFYCGPKTADLLLTEMIKPITEHLLEQKMIDGWFFIRYSDPKLHTRVRFRIPDSRCLAPVILTVKNQSTPFLEQDLIWRIQIDTYMREIERYGSRSMEFSEQLFYYESRMIVDMLSMIEGDEGEHIRWLFALRAIDSLLEDFGFDMQQRYAQVTMLRESFGREHNINRNLKSQLEKKFRGERKSVSEVMDSSKDEASELLPLFQLIKQKSQDSAPIIKQILKLRDDEMLEMRLHELLASYSHMLANRLFKSKQRTHELVLYDYLHRYYKSEIARQKYSKINAAKKVKK